MTNQIIADQKLKRALALYEEKRIAILEEKIDCEIDFSENFEKRMQKLFCFQRKPYYKFINTASKKAVACILIIVISFTTTVFSVKALREPVVSFIVEVYEKYSKLIFSQKDESKSNNTKGRIYEPSYLPQGFSLSVKMNIDLDCKREYMNSAGALIFYEQIQTDNANMNIDTEGIVYEDISINDLTGIYFMQKGFHQLYWFDGNFLFSISVPKEISKDEVFKIAESVQ